MSSNLLKLNRNKTQLLVVSPKVRLQQTKNLLIDMNPEVCNLGVVLDATLIISVTKAAFLQLSLLAITH